jgi:Niemann-Pick C1 protein
MFASVSAYGGSKLRVAFDVASLVPSKSYINSFIAALETFAEPDVYTCTAFFRDVDFSSSVIQSQITSYVNELVELPQISSYPRHFWLHDFQNFTQASKNSTQGWDINFEEQLDMFLQDEYFRRLYSNLIVRDTTVVNTTHGGTMTASAVIIPLDNIDRTNVRDQVKFLSEQEGISRDYYKKLQSIIGKELDRMPFFTFLPPDKFFILWLYSIAVQELIMSTVASVIAVAIITFLFIPRLSALCIVMLAILMIYMDVLGLMYWAGFSINPVTLIAILMSIGLMVDYVLHIVMRCFEVNARVIRRGQEGADDGSGDTPKVNVDVYDCLSTMGVSVLIGGASTVLSTIPLAFSTSEIFFSIFVIFFGFVTFSLLHALIFVPAILASLNCQHRIEMKSTNITEDNRISD